MQTIQCQKNENNQPSGDSKDDQQIEQSPKITITPRKKLMQTKTRRAIQDLLIYQIIHPLTKVDVMTI